ncbi:MAG TPA: PAS domain S-box protein [Terriglobales bacterium]|nr:PAS domain S-box protein [Terriglobales bacterium]
MHNGVGMNTALEPVPELSAKLAPTSLFSAALGACPEAMAVIEAGKIVWCNSAHARLFGYANARELRGRPLADLLPRNHPCTSRGEGNPIPNCGFPACQFRGRLKDGSCVEMESSCRKFRVGERRLRVIVSRDISQVERRRVAREGEARFRAIFEASAIGIGHFTLEGKIAESNRALEEMLAYSHQELQGMPFARITHPDDLPREERLLAEMITGKRDGYRLEKRYLRKDGAVVWGRLNVSLVRGPGGEPQFAIKMVEDITEHKRAEAALRESQKVEAVGRLVAGLAHDFANLLTGIGILSDLLAMELKSQPGGQRAREIQLASEHGCALIRKLLFVARQHVSDNKVLSLETVVEDMRDLLGKMIEERIEMSIHSAPGLGYVKADPAEMQQVILNLALNARDAMPEGGRLSIDLSNSCLNARAAAATGLEAGGYVALDIADNGHGMDEQTRVHLFEPFFTTKQPGQGTGLGLATVKAIVNQAGGSIAVESTPGRGTRMRVLLPRVEGELEWRGSGTHEQLSLTGRETVLLVEDDERVRTSVEQVLTQCGYQVLVAANGDEAVRRVRQHLGAIQLLLVDLVMPGANGREVVKQIAPLQPQARVLFISGYGTGGEEAVDGRIFRKPFTGGALARKVREVLDAGPPHETRGPRSGRGDGKGTDSRRRKSC